MAHETQVGPVTTLTQQEKIVRYIEIAICEGAKPVLGGHAAKRIEWHRVIRRAEYLRRSSERNANRSRGGVRPRAFNHFRVKD
jgi:Aldehyde dehydrogenase family